MKKNILVRKGWFLLLPILLLASFLRLYRLDNVPISPYWEEAALGYDAFSIAETGNDHHGNSYPLIAFPSFGDYKPSGYFYAIVPFIKLFGLSVWSVRLPSAIAGIVSVALLYLIGKELFTARVGLIASLLLATQPWAIQFSRGGWEVNLAMTLLLTGAYLLLKARQHTWILPIATFFFCLSMYTYHAARLFAPLLGGIGGGWILWSWWKDRVSSRSMRIYLIPLVFTLFVGCVFLVPLVLNLGNKEVSSRFTDTSIFSQLQPILDSNQAIASHGNTRLARVFYHRYWYFGNSIVHQWTRHFSVDFLFVRGDGNLRHWNGRIGELYWVELPFLLVSLFLLLISVWKKNKEKWPLLATISWILLAAVPPALVTPAPHALRFLFAAPAFSLLTAYGFSKGLDLPKSRRSMNAFFAVVVILYILSFQRYIVWYAGSYPFQSASDWQYGYKELYDVLAKNKKDGEQVYITREQGRPAMYYLFYSHFDPKKLQAMEPQLPKDQLELLQVGDYHFTDRIDSSEKGLIATSATRIIKDGQLIQTIMDPERRIVWVVWRR